MSDVYDIWLYPLQDCDEQSMKCQISSTGQMGNFISRPVYKYGTCTAQLHMY